MNVYVSMGTTIRRSAKTHRERKAGEFHRKARTRGPSTAEIQAESPCPVSRISIPSKALVLFSKVI